LAEAAKPGDDELVVFLVQRIKLAFWSGLQAGEVIGQLQ